LVFFFAGQFFPGHSSERDSLASALCGTMAEKEKKGGDLTGMGWRQGGARDRAAKLGFGGPTRLVASQRQWRRTTLTSASLGVQPRLPMKDRTPRVLTPMGTTGAWHGGWLAASGSVKRGAPRKAAMLGQGAPPVTGGGARRGARPTLDNSETRRPWLSDSGERTASSPGIRLYRNFG
jgi:hypothetical protein